MADLIKLNTFNRFNLPKIKLEFRGFIGQCSGPDLSRICGSGCASASLMIQWLKITFLAFIFAFSFNKVNKIEEKLRFRAQPDVCAIFNISESTCIIL